MDFAKQTVRKALDEAKAYLAQPDSPRLSEADTKIHFIEPIIMALGWQGIGVVTREYFVKSSREYIDFLISSGGRPMLAIEAKSLQSPLVEKHAAQLVQYCAVEGIEWAALTNGCELQLFNTFLKPNLHAKRVLNVDLLAYSTDEEFDSLFQQLRVLSQESLTSNESNIWLKQRRMDTVLRSALLDTKTTTVKTLVKVLMDHDINATGSEIVNWVRANLSTKPAMPKKTAPLPPSFERSPPIGKPPERNAMPLSRARNAPYGVTTRQLINAGFLQPGEKLFLRKGDGQTAQATLDASGRIQWNGNLYPSLSDRAFISLMGWQAMNGWKYWFVERNGKLETLATLRERFIASQNARNVTSRPADQ